jgi:hypothetical protein
MNKQIFITLVFILFAIVCNPRKSIAQTTPVEIDAKTFILSNESPGYLIDNLIAAGFRDSSLYAVMQYLQPLSGGVIPQWFMDTLAVCPANSDVFTFGLWRFSDPSNNPIGIAEDGTLVIAPIYGRDYSVKEGYTTYNDTLVPVSLKVFTKAIAPQYYLDAGSNTVQTPSGRVITNYKVFAIAWSLEPPTTFVLTNEGGLIDDLIRAGHGTKNLYQVLQLLKPKSGGVITEEFMATLAKCPAGSEIFNTQLNNYTGFNNPVCINTDGTCNILGIFGNDYLLKDGYSTIPLNQNGYTPELFTHANSAENYIDAGASSGQSRYKTFAIAWKASTTFILSNEGGLIDDLIRAGHGTKNLYQTLEILKPKSGGIISDEFMATLAKCPAGSKIFTVLLNNFSSEYNNPIGINSDGTLIVAQILGKNYLQLNGYNTFPDNQPGYAAKLFTYANSADKYIDAGTNVAGGVTTYYKAFAIAWKSSTTFVLSNEGGLIDDLIRAGHGTKNLYQTLEVLKPKSGGVISDEFMATLANCPKGSEIFTAALSEVSPPINNPIGISTDGTLIVVPLYGKDYFHHNGYLTYQDTLVPVGLTIFTYSTSPQYYIDAGASGSGTRYKAFAIAWSAPAVGIHDTETSLKSPSVYPNPTTGKFSARLNDTVGQVQYSQFSVERIEVVDLNGKILENFKLLPETGNPEFDISHLKPGVYFCRIKTENSVFISKIILK